MPVCRKLAMPSAAARGSGWRQCTGQAGDLVEISATETATPGGTRALAVTGGVITSAGLVLAATFSVLAVLPLVTMTEIGFVVACGVLLDTRRPQRPKGTRPESQPNGDAFRRRAAQDSSPPPA